MKITICGNTEELCGGYELGDFTGEATVAMVEAAIKSLEAAGHEVEVNSTFRDWNGGRHSRDQCGGGRRWGYATSWVACHAETVPEAVRDAMESASDAMACASDEWQEMAYRDEFEIT
jgi:hypothetical protein